MKPETEEGSEFRVDDRRHWARGEDTEESADPERLPGAVEEFRRRAEEAEDKLKEYIAAYKEHEQEQERFRVRVAGDVERRVESKFGEILNSLLETLDHLDLALTHAGGAAGASALVEGVSMARDGFLAALAEQGVRRIFPDGKEFDPNVAEAIRVDPVAEQDRDGTVTVTLRPGYLLGDRVVRAARVAVARYDPEAPPATADK